MALAREILDRRLWYHDVEVVGGLRTRFPEDYEVNPVLRRVDACNEAFLHRMSEHMGRDLSGRSVLDLGCADGLFAIWAARHGANRVVGIERNRYNCDHAAWLRDVLSLEQLDVRWGCIEREVGAESFDFVLCASLVYHLINPLGTLHLLRRHCTQSLLLSSAVDLPDGDGSPMQRLDRYASGAHGMWSFNVPMLRQLITTAGFDIDHEVIDDTEGGRHFFAVARPGRFAEHHVFAETLDQEFPINVERRRDRVRAMWRNLAEASVSPVAVFGAGTHTPWMLDQVKSIPGVSVSCVLDDRIPPGGTVAGLSVRRPTEIDPLSFGAVVLSSWHQIEPLRARAEALFGNAVSVVMPGD